MPIQRASSLSAKQVCIRPVSLQHFSFRKAFFENLNDSLLCGQTVSKGVPSRSLSASGKRRYGKDGREQEEAIERIHHCVDFSKSKGDHGGIASVMVHHAYAPEVNKVCSRHLPLPARETWIQQSSESHESDFLERFAAQNVSFDT